MHLIVEGSDNILKASVTIQVEQGDKGEGALTVTGTLFSGNDDDFNPDVTDDQDLADNGIDSVTITP